jgi:hypothetical protein
MRCSTILAKVLPIVSLLMSVVACNFPIVQTPVPALTPTPTIFIAPSATPTGTATPEPTLTPLPPTKEISPTPPPSDTPLPTETPVPTLDMPYGDVSGLMQGVCFKYLDSLKGQTLRFNSNGDLAGFYTQVDQSKKCVELVPRQTFDFSAQQIIGTVIGGQGCGLVITYVRTDMNDSAKTRKIFLNAAVSGDCQYALLQPVLLSIDRSDYQTQLTVTGP